MALKYTIMLNDKNLLKLQLFEVLPSLIKEDFQNKEYTIIQTLYF